MNRFACISLLALVAASPATQPSTNYKLVWSDEFNKPGSPDPDKWSFEIGKIRNNEAQYYTDRPENIRIEDGHLLIEARKEDFHGAHYTSASIETLHHFDFTYGRVECRAKLPAGRGSWPAIWTLGSNIHSAGWPACGEIDIMEQVGFDPLKIHGSIHTKSYNHVHHTEKTAVTKVIDPAADFHIYTMDWTPVQITISTDGHPYFTFINEHTGKDAWPFDAPQFLKLNLAIGGAWGGQKGIDAASFPQRYEIDYIRVYQPAPRP
jgi:beta-glucanase (GH16 family)